MDTAFTGQADHTLDAKNRLTVPARFRHLFGEGVVVAKDIEQCVAVWPSASYEQFCEQALAGEHPMSPRGRKLRAYLAGNAVSGDLDGAGRTAIQPFLMEHGGLDREVTVVGVGDHLQVWNREAWKTYNQQLADDMAAISAAFDAPAGDLRGSS